MSGRDNHARPQRILMVCTGNICRSPTAEAVLRHGLAAVPWGDRVQVDSAGTHAWHEGAPPDERSIAHAARRGYDLRPQRARQIVAQDFEHFDLLVAMDESHVRHLRAQCPPAQAHKIRLLLSFVEDRGHGLPGLSVPDPYYGGAAGFERVLDLVEAGCSALQQYLHSAQGSAAPPTPPQRIQPI